MSMLPSSLILGFATGLSLIVAIGSQNAFVLRQGIRREHVLLTMILCIVSDCVLIWAGVNGVGFIVQRAPWILTVARVGGALFLLTYSLLALRRAISPGVLVANQLTSSATAWSVAATTLILTWLNPHVYIDTVLLLGSIGVAQGHGAPAFALGAMLASAIWFTALGYAARFLSRFFASAKAWRILDALIAICMLTFAILLIAPAFSA